MNRFAVSVAVISFVGLWRFRWNVIPVVLASAAAGLVYKLLVAEARAAGLPGEPVFILRFRWGR